MARISRPLKAVLGVVVIAIIAISWYLASPIFLPGPSLDDDSELDEDLEQSEVTVLLSGTLQQVDMGHTGSGIVQLVQSDLGNQSIFFINVSITNGPDLYVYLSEQNSFSGINDGPGEFVSLGLVPAVIGTFSVAIPNHVNGTDYASVLIWCLRFTVLFTYAILS
ncbi:MAG: DM13 domain-containing protein [Candidatus Thorarchaeota archaeon]|jgi:hypothetical protein